MSEDAKAEDEDAIHAPWKAKDIKKIWREVWTGSDRASVLLCGALLDRGLDHLLRAKMRQESGASDDDMDKLLSPNHPKAAMVGFASRARLAHLLGLIDRETSDALRKLARLRNEYAHKDVIGEITVEMVQPIADAAPQGISSGADIIRNGEFCAHHPPARRFLVSIVIGLHATIAIRIQAIQAGRPQGNQGRQGTP